MQKEKPITLPDIDREVEESNQKLLDLLHELRRLEVYILEEEARVGPAPWIQPLRTQAAEMRRVGRAMFGQLCDLQKLAAQAELAQLDLEHVRECPHCSESFPPN